MTEGDEPRPITLRCDRCKREATYARGIDLSIPATVATIVVSRCDRCDDGDFGTEWWLDAAGNELEQAARAALTPTREDQSHD